MADVSPEVGGRAKRERKQTEVYVPAVEEKTFEVKEGKGTKLGDLSAVAENVKAHSKNDELLKVVHNILYRRMCKAQEVKQKILAFSGYTYADPKKERETDNFRVAKYAKGTLEDVLRMFGRPVTGSKEDQVGRLLDFLDKPSDAKETKTPAKAKEAAPKSRASTGGKSPSDKEWAKLKAAQAQLKADRKAFEKEKREFLRSKGEDAPEPEDDDEEEEKKPAARKASSGKKRKADEAEAENEEEEEEEKEEKPKVKPKATPKAKAEPKAKPAKKAAKESPKKEKKEAERPAKKPRKAAAAKADAAEGADEEMEEAAEKEGGEPEAAAKSPKAKPKEKAKPAAAAKKGKKGGAAEAAEEKKEEEEDKAEGDAEAKGADGAEAAEVPAAGEAAAEGAAKATEEDKGAEPTTEELKAAIQKYIADLPADEAVSVKNLRIHLEANVFLKELSAAKKEELKALLKEELK